MSITLSQFLHLHAAKDKQNTHTRIPDRDKGISSGSYYIDDEELGVFFQTYYNHVFSPANPQAEYLTEKQLIEFVNELQPDIFVIPDVWNDALLSLRNAKRWTNMKEILPENTKSLLKASAPVATGKFIFRVDSIIII